MQIGIDLGGTKTEAIGLDGDTVVAPRRRVATTPDYMGTLDSIARLVHEIEADAGSTGPWVSGFPEPSAAQRVSSRTPTPRGSTAARSLPISRARLGQPVRVANDANCFALSEAVDGAGQGLETVFGVILGTGVGGGISIRRRILEGPNQIAGEWGHNPLPWMTDEERARSARCYCGKYGCVETFLSGPGFERDYAFLSGTRRSSQDIVRAAADAGDVHATHALDRYIDRLARALAAVINVLDPDAVVLGGGMSNLPRLPSAVSAILPEYVFSDTVATKVVLNLHGDSSGVRGAAWLWGRA